MQTNLNNKKTFIGILSTSQSAVKKVVSNEIQTQEFSTYK